MAQMQIQQETYQKLLAAERRITDSIASYDTAEKCGIDCQKYRNDMAAQLKFLQELKANYAPQ